MSCSNENKSYIGVDESWQANVFMKSFFNFHDMVEREQDLHES